MSVFLLKRLATFVATLVAASVVVFLVLEILPGDAAQMMMGPDASPDAVRALAAKLGLDRPPLERYLDWVGGMLRGDLGLSYAYSSPVAELIGECFDDKGQFVLDAEQRLIVDDAGSALPASGRRSFLALETHAGAYGRPSGLPIFLAAELAACQGAMLELSDAPAKAPGPEAGMGGLRVAVTFAKT